MWGCDYNGIGYGNWFFGGGIIGLAITILIIVIVATLIIKFVRSNQFGSSKNLDKTDSLKILKMRFAKGEINDQEYQKMEEMLRF